MPPEQSTISPNQVQNKLSHKVIFLVLTVLIIITALIVIDRQRCDPLLSKWMNPRCNPSPLSQQDTSTWQTYRNDEGGFEFQHPFSTYKVIDDTGAVIFDANALMITHNSIYSKSYDLSNFTDKEIGKFTWKCGYQFTSKDQLTCFYFLNRGEAFIFNFNIEDHVAYQILSTFRFTEPIPIDWRTYRNEEFGFEFKYPGDWNTYNSDGYIRLGTPQPSDYPLQFGFSVEKSFDDIKRKYNAEENNLISYMKTQYNYPIFTKEINNLSWICNDTAGDGPGDTRNCVTERENGELIFLRFSTSDLIMDQILSTFRFTE